tara:strand:+ start:106834 stop:109380 length:2547 start_codon:yes stop_codon:yes gene_type:complete
MKKIIIQLLITIFLFSFSINLKGQENNIKYNNCKSFLELEVKEKVDNPSKEFRKDSIENGIINCTPLIFKDNLSHRLIYTIIGEPYQKAINLSFLPVSFFIDIYLSDNKEVPNISDVNIEDTNTFNSIPKISETIIKLLNIFLLFLISFSIITKVFKSQQGDTGQTNIKTIYRLIVAFGLLFPIAGIGGYSFFQFILMIVIAASITIANVLSIFIFLILTMIEVENDYTIAKSTSFDGLLTTVIEASPTKTTLYENYSNLVNQSLCNIYQLNDTIRTNIGSPKQLKLNIEKTDSFLYCVKNETPKYNFNSSTTNFSKLKNCAENLHKKNFYIYKTENQKTQDIKLSSITCEPYKQNTNPQLIKGFEEEAFKHALDIYRLNCQKYTNITSDRPVMNNFVCPELYDFGEYEVLESEGVFRYNLISKKRVSREEESQLYENIKSEIKLNAVNTLKDYILTSGSEEMDLLLSQGSDLFENKKEELSIKLTNNLYNLFNKGWVASFVFFNPNFVSSSNALKNLHNKYDNIFTEYDISDEISEKTKVNIENTLPNDIFVQQVYNSNELNSFGQSEKQKELDDEINKKILKKNALTIEQLMNKKDYYKCIKDNECNEIIRFNIFKELNEKGQSLITNGISIAASATIVNSMTMNPVIKSAAKTMNGFGILLITAGAFLVIILPAVPFIIFSIIVINWIYSAFKILILSVINILSLFLESENSEEFINKNDSVEGNLIKSVSNIFFTPIFLTLSCLISMFLIFIMVNILYLTLFLIIEVFSVSFFGMDSISSIYMNIFYLIVFIVLLLMIVIQNTLKINEITTNLMTMLNLQIDIGDETNIVNNFIEKVKSKVFLK